RITQLKVDLNEELEMAFDGVHIAGATNYPGDVEPGILDRFSMMDVLEPAVDDRIAYVKHLFDFHQHPVEVEEAEWQVAMEAAEGWSYRDLKDLASKAADRAMFENFHLKEKDAPSVVKCEHVFAALSQLKKRKGGNRSRSPSPARPPSPSPNTCRLCGL